MLRERTFFLERKKKKMFSEQKSREKQSVLLKIGKFRGGGFTFNKSKAKRLDNRPGIFDENSMKFTRAKLPSIDFGRFNTPTRTA